MPDLSVTARPQGTDHDEQQYRAEFEKFRSEKARLTKLGRDIAFEWSRRVIYGMPPHLPQQVEPKVIELGPLKFTIVPDPGMPPGEVHIVSRHGKVVITGLPE